MKKLFILFLSMMTLPLLMFSQTHNNVRLYPKEDTLCYSNNLYLWIAGQSFTPVSYLWSDGSTTSSLQVTASGTYGVTVTGYLGNSQRLITLTKTKTLYILPKPEIVPSTPLWVCKLDTVRLSAVSGYSTIRWNNGFVGNNYEKVFTSLNTGGAVPDTLSVWYTASNGLCEVNSDTVLLRGIRRPEGLATPFCDVINLDTSGFIRCGIVLEFIYPVQYEVEFTNMADPNDIITYYPILGKRKIPLNILTPGNSYYVRTRAIINGVPYCWGSVCTISLMAPTQEQYVKEVSYYDFKTIKLFKIYNISGSLLFQREDTCFRREWLDNLPNQTYVVMTIDGENKPTFNKINNIK